MSPGGSGVKCYVSDDSARRWFIPRGTIQRRAKAIGKTWNFFVQKPPGTLLGPSVLRGKCSVEVSREGASPVCLPLGCPEKPQKAKAKLSFTVWCVEPCCHPAREGLWAHLLGAPEASAVRAGLWAQSTQHRAAVCLERSVSGSVPLTVSCSYREAQCIFTWLLCKILLCTGEWGGTGAKGRGRGRTRGRQDEQSGSRWAAS